MQEDKKIFWYIIGTIFVLFIVLSLGMYKIKSDFDAKIASQNEYFNSKIDSISETLSNDMMAIQNMIKSVDDVNKNRYSELNSSISKVQSESQTAKTQLESQIANIEVSGTDFSKIAQESLPSVVSVLTNNGQGSGVIISSDGQIITNYHVIDGAKSISVVTYDKSIYKVDVLGYDDSVDIAVLKIMANETFHKLKLGDSSVV
jgi:S1-C subfamily serine protease